MVSKQGMPFARKGDGLVPGQLVWTGGVQDLRPILKLLFVPVKMQCDHGEVGLKRLSHLCSVRYDIIESNTPLQA
jgi:hypothetical protein